MNSFKHSAILREKNDRSKNPHRRSRGKRNRVKSHLHVCQLEKMTLFPRSVPCWRGIQIWACTSSFWGWQDMIRGMTLVLAKSPCRLRRTWWIRPPSLSKQLLVSKGLSDTRPMGQIFCQSMRILTTKINQSSRGSTRVLSRALPSRLVGCYPSSTTRLQILRIFLIVKCGIFSQTT